MIYLDNSATTRVSEAAAAKMLAAAREVWGNPSSLHDAGLAAEHLLDEARARVTAALGADRREGLLVFTGSGSEANNLAVFGVADAKKYPLKKRIVTDDSQHASIMRPLERLEQRGFEIVRVSTSGGRIDPDEIAAAVDGNTVLVTIMLVNNETGAIYDVASAFTEAKRKNSAVVTHTDAVQGFHKLTFSPKSLHADLVSISGHKLCAPKGIGALWIDGDIVKSKRIVPYILGGGQENGFRSGTENVPGAAAFGEALAAPFDAQNAGEIRGQIISSLPDGIKVNLPEHPAPHIISLTLPGIKSETMLHFLSSRGICVSSGSACSSHGHKSGALTAFGLSTAQADCTIRVSLGGSESESDAEALISALDEGVRTLIKI